MDVNKQLLQQAAAQQIISEQQVDALYQFLQARTQATPKFTLTHVLYYLGGMIAIGAMTLFMNLGWESFGGAGLVVICLVYAAVGLALTQRFAGQLLVIPAGICATFVVCLTPLTIYGLQQWWGLWPDDSVYRDYHRYIQWHWLYMELGTLVAGVLVAWRYRYPFLVMPIAVTLWYMTMDISAMLAAGDDSWELRKTVSMYSGLVMVAIAFWVDMRSVHKGDYAFWLYVFGVLAFWGGLSAHDSDQEWAKFMYFVINLVMIGLGAMLVRKVFVICGALGACAYLGHLAADVFADSLLFPMVLSAIGLAVIYLGILWQKHEQRISQQLRGYLPEPVRRLLAAKSQ